ncbi:glyceraldehyde-3-phosphate dehydrogenase, partial [Streptomyces scopuliridis]|uniref:glyceraldehyde-3-phosphate dehydrogenase n=1 Tax=Streptomyces scopuliridis TaxID=452529 RepID=UPI00368481BE
MTVAEESFTNWKNREEIAEAMIPIIGKLHRERDITVLLHSRSLVNKSVISILKTHRFARQIAGEELSVTQTLPFLRALTTLDLGPSQIDIGMLAATYKADDRGLSEEEFTAEAVAGATGDNKIERREPRDVVLYGFGRIGRLLARLLIEKTGSGNGLRLRAIVVRKGAGQDIVKRASLLRRDSVHGQFQGTITVDEANSKIIANGNEIKVIYSDDPTSVDYTAYGIKNAILIDNTGRWRDREGLSKHLRPGIDKVVLTAPGKGDVPNVVHGVNHTMIKADEQILSCASCTTNAIVPPLKAMADEYGVLRGHVETVHSFTNDQNLLDNYHQSDRRGRSAPLNMVITETGAASAVAKALPDLNARITGSSIRVPVPDVSIAILSLQLARETSREEVLDYLRNVSLNSPLKRQIDFISAPDAVSSDFIGSRHASIVDAGATKVEGDNAILYLWYDNEFGYSCQVIRVVQHVSGVEYPTYPAPAQGAGAPADEHGVHQRAETDGDEEHGAVV